MFICFLFAGGPLRRSSATADRKRQLERHQHDVMTQLRLSLINHRKQLPPINRTVGVAPNRRRPSVEPPPRQLLCQFQQVPPTP